nr:immunoglobulin heavy chain junction region [Mus musculus]
CAREGTVVDNYYVMDYW